MARKSAKPGKTITHFTHDAVPDPSTPEIGCTMLLPDDERFATADRSRYQWYGCTAPGKKTRYIGFPCHTPLEADFARFLNAAPDVLHYVKNERLGFTIPYKEGDSTRHYYPDFIIETRDPANPRATPHIIAETKGERWSDTLLEKQAAHAWTAKPTASGAFAPWTYHFIDEGPFRHALTHGATTLASLLTILEAPP